MLEVSAVQYTPGRDNVLVVLRQTSGLHMGHQVNVELSEKDDLKKVEWTDEDLARAAQTKVREQFDDRTLVVKGA